MKNRSRYPAVLGSMALILSISGAAMDPGAAADLKPVTVFMQPSVSTDAIWAAEANGLFKAEGLDVQTRVFPSGTTALQTFKTGIGDIITTGDLPALQYWQNGGSYRVIAAVERDTNGYAAASKIEIKSPKDLIGKVLATRVGSTGSYFVSEYLAKNGIDEKSVTVKNLDPPLMPPALCRGDIDAFFVWEPSPAKAVQICGDKAKYLTTAEGYIVGYNVVGARAEWLATPEGADIAKRFLRAARKGAEMAAADPKAIAAYLNKKFGFTEAEVESQHAVMERVLKLDEQFFADFCNENRWQQRAGLQTAPSDLAKWVWPDGLKSIDPKLVGAAPPPC